MSIFNNNGRSISKNDDNNFSLSKQGLPNNLVRIFLNNDIATFVYSDGQVQMKPVACLQPAEQQLLQESRLEVQQAEEQFRHEMTDFQQNMRDNMQRLRDNLSNMFCKYIELDSSLTSLEPKLTCPTLIKQLPTLSHQDTTWPTQLPIPINSSRSRSRSNSSRSRYTTLT